MCRLDFLAAVSQKGSRTWYKCAVGCRPLVVVYSTGEIWTQ